MTNEELITYLSGNFPDTTVSLGKQFVEMTVPNDKLVDISLNLKSNPLTSFDFLLCLSGVDHQDCMEIIYHLESTKNHHIIVLKVKTLNRDELEIDTLSEVWRTAKYHEREVYDLLGIKFRNHTDLRRLFLEDGWGFPLRKDYKDEVRIIERI